MAVAALLALLFGVVLRPGRPQRAAARPVARAEGRVIVEVLNASGQVGLARAATRRLRDAGLDVVYFGNDDADDRDSTEVLVRRGDARNGRVVAEALGTGTVRTAPDAGRLVDVTVRLGRDFRGAALVGQP